MVPFCQILSEKGYVKRMKSNTFNLQHRGTIGKSVGKMRLNDTMSDFIVCHTHDHILYFRYYQYDWNTDVVLSFTWSQCNAITNYYIILILEICNIITILFCSYSRYDLFSDGLFFWFIQYICSPHNNKICNILLSSSSLIKDYLIYI